MDNRICTKNLVKSWQGTPIRYICVSKRHTFGKLGYPLVDKGDDGFFTIIVVLFICKF